MTQQVQQEFTRLSCNTSNNIVNYKSKLSDDDISIVGIELIVDKFITNLLLVGIYLFCALEEADWNIFSANNGVNDIFVDDTKWNISTVEGAIFNQSC